MATEEVLKVAREDGVMVLTFNRPSVLNAMNVAMAEAVLAALGEAAADEGVRAILFQGTGKGFMAGGDIADFAGNLDRAGEGIARLIKPIHDFMELLRNVQKPVIAGVHGTAAGVAVSLIAACDMVVAGDQTKFTTAYTNIGGTPDGGMTWFLPRKLGLARATELIMLGERFMAIDALELGLINRVVPEDQVAGEAMALARRLASGPTKSYGVIKQLLNQSHRVDFRTQLDEEARLFQGVAATADFREGATAFFEKRKPNFTGT